jgi:hypothetical protein
MDTTLVRIGIPGIALALSALFVAATWRTGEGLQPAARRRRTILAGAGVAIWLAAMAAAALSGWLGPLRSAPAADRDLVRVDAGDDAAPWPGRRSGAASRTSCRSWR